MGTIYKIISPSGKIYIGQTINLHGRLNRYKNLLCKSQIKLYNSLCKYGFEKHTIEILHSNVDASKMNELENYYISLYKCCEKGLNCAKEASLPMKGRRHSESTKIKMREKAIGRKNSIETRLKQRNAKLGKVGIRLGYSMSQECKNKIQTTRQLRKHLYNYRTTKLTVEQVLEIRNLFSNDSTLLVKEVALLYGVTATNISSIKNYKTWKSIILNQ